MTDLRNLKNEVNLTDSAKKQLETMVNLETLL